MTSKDVLKFLFDRWKEKHVGGTQDDYADHLDMSRPHMNQFMTGKRIPPISTMKRILLTEGYKPTDFTIDINIELSDAKAARNRFEDMFNNLETIVTMGGDNRILGIRINLEEFAEGARSHKGKKERRTTAEEGNLAANEKVKKKPVLKQRGGSSR